MNESLIDPPPVARSPPRKTVCVALAVIGLIVVAASIATGVTLASLAAHAKAANPSLTTAKVDAVLSDPEAYLAVETPTLSHVHSLAIKNVSCVVRAVEDNQAVLGSMVLASPTSPADLSRKGAKLVHLALQASNASAVRRALVYRHSLTLDCHASLAIGVWRVVDVPYSVALPRITVPGARNMTSAAPADTTPAFPSHVSVGGSLPASLGLGADMPACALAVSWDKNLTALSSLEVRWPALAYTIADDAATEAVTWHVHTTPVHVDLAVARTLCLSAQVESATCTQAADATHDARCTGLSTVQHAIDAMLHAPSVRFDAVSSSPVSQQSFGAKLIGDHFATLAVHTGAAEPSAAGQVQARRGGPAPAANSSSSSSGGGMDDAPKCVLINVDAFFFLRGCGVKQVLPGFNDGLSITANITVKDDTPVAVGQANVSWGDDVDGARYDAQARLSANVTVGHTRLIDGWAWLGKPTSSKSVQVKAQHANATRVGFFDGFLNANQTDVGDVAVLDLWSDVAWGAHPLLHHSAGHAEVNKSAHVMTFNMSTVRPLTKAPVLNSFTRVSWNTTGAIQANMTEKLTWFGRTAIAVNATYNLNVDNKSFDWALNCTRNTTTKLLGNTIRVAWDTSNKSFSGYINMQNTGLHVNNRTVSGSVYHPSGQKVVFVHMDSNRDFLFDGNATWSTGDNGNATITATANVSVVNASFTRDTYVLTLKHSQWSTDGGLFVENQTLVVVHTRNITHSLTTKDTLLNSTLAVYKSSNKTLAGLNRLHLTGSLRVKTHNNTQETAVLLAHDNGDLESHSHFVQQSFNVSHNGTLKLATVVGVNWLTGGKLDLAGRLFAVLPSLRPHVMTLGVLKVDSVQRIAVNMSKDDFRANLSSAWNIDSASNYSIDTSLAYLGANELPRSSRFTFFKRAHNDTVNMTLTSNNDLKSNAVVSWSSFNHTMAANVTANVTWRFDRRSTTLRMQANDQTNTAALYLVHYLNGTRELFSDNNLTVHNDHGFNVTHHMLFALKATPGNMSLSLFANTSANSDLDESKGGGASIMGLNFSSVYDNTNLLALSVMSNNNVTTSRGSRNNYNYNVNYVDYANNFNFYNGGVYAAHMVCDNSCSGYNYNGVCDDGAGLPLNGQPVLGYTSNCSYGSDCNDCGGRAPNNNFFPICSDSCPGRNSDGVCDDGLGWPLNGQMTYGLSGMCNPGTDCSDCWNRYVCFYNCPPAFQPMSGGSSSDSLDSMAMHLRWTARYKSECPREFNMSMGVDNGMTMTIDRLKMTCPTLTPRANTSTTKTTTKTTTKPVLTTTTKPVLTTTMTKPVLTTTTTTTKGTSTVAGTSASVVKVTTTAATTTTTTTADGAQVFTTTTTTTKAQIVTDANGNPAATEAATSHSSSSSTLIIAVGAGAGGGVALLLIILIVAVIVTRSGHATAPQSAVTTQPYINPAYDNGLSGKPPSKPVVNPFLELHSET